MAKRKHKITRRDKMKSTGPKVVAVGRISGGVRETWIPFEALSEEGRAIGLRVCGSKARVEEIVNA